METTTTTKPLGQPIEGEDRDATVVCPFHGSYGLYFYGVRNDFCIPCGKQKAKTDRDAQKRFLKLDELRQKAKRAHQAAAAHASRPAARPRAARWEPWEPVSAKGFSMGADLTRTNELPAE